MTIFQTIFCLSFAEKYSKKNNSFFDVHCVVLSLSDAVISLLKLWKIFIFSFVIVVHNNIIRMNKGEYKKTGPLSKLPKGKNWFIGLNAENYRLPIFREEILYFSKKEKIYSKRFLTWCVLFVLNYFNFET